MSGKFHMMCFDFNSFAAAISTLRKLKSFFKSTHVTITGVVYLNAPERVKGSYI